MAGLKFLINEMMSRKLTFYFKAIPMRRSRASVCDIFDLFTVEALPCFEVKIFETCNVDYVRLIYDQPTVKCLQCSYKTNHLYRGSCINCLCVVYEPDNIYFMCDMDCYLVKLLEDISKRMQIPVFLIYGYPVSKSDYFYMIQYISCNHDICTISYADDEEYKLYLKLLLDIDSNDFVFTEFNSINYDECYKFYSFHRKDDVS